LLTTFKTNDDAYEWFGRLPSHEALSAYGLMQFTEMSQVTDLVDATMMANLKKWILSRKDNKGGFMRNAEALDSFGRAPESITNAYIIWSLTSAGITDVAAEITQLKSQADA
jgi:hypothetical protein